MELLVFGHAGARVLVFPTRQGRFFDYENWGLVGSLATSINDGNIQLYCVDSIDSESFYAKWSDPQGRIARHNHYEGYILEEVLPLTRSKNANPFLVAHGCSIGAYHSANIAFRHPHLFHKLVAFSGRYDLTQNLGVFPDLFSGYYDQDIYFHTPNHFLPNLTDEGLLDPLRRMEVTLTVGREDPFHGSTLDLSKALAARGIAHTLAIWSGEAHSARYWRQMTKLYL